MATSTTKTNKPINPRGNDQSPKGYNRAALYSGKALDFDGVNDVLTMPTALTSSLSTTSVTFVTNVKTDFATWTGTRDDAFSFSERGVILAFNNGTIYYYYRHQSASWRNLQVPNANFKPQEWNQMVTTIDLNADTWKAYINGVEVASSGTYSDTAIAYDANALTIGAQAGARFFDGQIAGFKIFNTALTAAQVADLYNNPEKIVPTGVEDTALKLWLPMMEGAGTTAYDGSGNGNHGTISGATWTHGIGASVAQTAVIDWNKGTNLVKNSEDITASSWGSTTGGTIITANQATAPDGSITADKIATTIDVSAQNHDVRTNADINMGGGAVTMSAYLKKGTANFARLRFAGTTQQVRAWFDLENGLVSDVDGGGVATIEDAGNGWYRCIMSEPGNLVSGNSNYGQIFVQTLGAFQTQFVGTGEYIYAWGTQINYGEEAEPYIPTLSTAQTSDVLLPQGLTSGRDITGVNLFENVRKQGALNLDGNSWAEVHDNASLDFGTGAFTLEAWAKFSYVAQGSSLNAILTLGGDTGQLNQGRAALVSLSGSKMSFYYNASSHSSTSTFSDGDWVHFVGVYDETNAIVYINGAEESTTARTASSITNTDVKMIGRDSIATRYYHDQIAQPRIYNRALTAEEVERNYNAGKNIYK